MKDRETAFNVIAGIIANDQNLEYSEKTELLKWLRQVEDQVAEIEAARRQRDRAVAKRVSAPERCSNPTHWDEPHPCPMCKASATSRPRP